MKCGSVTFSLIFPNLPVTSTLLLRFLIDNQYRAVFEQENTDAKEITYGEMEKAIDEYNKKL